MLTPAIDDPNRKAELKRKAEHPEEFGSPKIDLQEVTQRKLEGHLLVTESGLRPPVEPEDQETEDQRIAREQAEEAAKVRAAWVDYLDQSVADIVAELGTVQDVEQLTTMSTIEAETKNRKTLIEAIATEIAKREPN